MKHILVIEDNKELQDLFSIVLGGPNHSLSHAATRAQVQALVQNRPDLIILDLDFQFFNDGGSEVFSEIRSANVYPRIPILILSINPKKLKEYEGLPNTEIADKPFDLRTVTEKVKLLLGEL